VTYSGDPTLTTTYAYDTTTATGTAPIGRLSSITKGSGASASVIGYTYDLFGRTLQDGVQGNALGYTYDGNGNRISIAYPGNVTACYTYDVADRQAALSYSTAAGANVCQGTTTPIVTSTPAAPTIYSAAGPLQQLHLANGIAETHTFDQRYYPTAITAGTLLAWTYTTDASGNITAITPGRSFSYQDFQYFLTQANAPTLWGTRTWAYDTIGNRLSEDRGGGAKDTYAYQVNAANPHGDTPLLETITLANSAGTKYLAYDLAGNVLLESTPTSHLDFLPDAAGKLSHMTEETSHETATLAYDGRGFLAKARNAVTDCGPAVTIPTYASEGLLYQRQQQNLFTSAVTAQTRVLYFAGRPVAQLDGVPATGMLTYLTVDHLGAPVLASSGAATASWSGGFEPFGRDFTTPSAQFSGIFLRLPGQWDDTVWDSMHLISGLYYNVNRWLDTATGRYSQADPYKRGGRSELFSYTNNDPLRATDPLGLFQVDNSCACNPPGINVGRAISQACKYLSRPGCRDALRSAPVPNLLRCYEERCGSPRIGSGPMISCDNAGSPCGENTLSGGNIILHTGGNADCPRFNSPTPPRGPRDYGQTLFHEIGHTCGVPGGDHEPNWWQDVQRVCTGWPP
jgi:RHS repeat-associated protein